MLKKILIVIHIFFGFTGYAQDKNDKVENHQFDFWIGDWNVYKFGTDTIAGISSIKPILDHKTIEENYQNLKYTYKGKSLNIYNPKTDKWEQFWVDNSGLRLYLSGEYKDNKMILSDCKTESNCNKITWTKMEDGTVRQEWEQSKDSGKSWKKVFDGHYKTRE